MVEIQEKNVRAFKNPKQKKQTRTALLILLLIAVGVGAGAYFLVPREEVYLLNDYDKAQVSSGNFISTTQASGAVVIPQQMSVNSPTEGYSYLLYVDEGSLVEKDEILAKMTSSDLEEEMEDLLDGLEDKQRSLELFIVQQEYERLRNNNSLEDFDDQIEEARETIEEKKALAAINSARSSEVESAEESLENLLSQKSDLELEIEESEAIYALNLATNEFDITQIETQIERLQVDLENLTIRSPMSGEVISVETALGVPGSLISQNSSLFTIAEPTSAMIELDVNEEYSSYLSIGDSVSLSVGSSGLTGTIDKIGRVAVASSDGLNSTITVTIQPDTINSSVISGATAVGEFIIETRENVMTLPRGSFLTTGNQKYLYRIQSEETAERIQVTYGEIQGTQVEIISGVNPGDQIITSSYQNFIQFEEIQLD